MDLTRGTEAAQYIFPSTFASLFLGGLTSLLCLFEVGGTVGLCGGVRSPGEADAFRRGYHRVQDS